MSETGAKVAAPIMALAFSSDCTFHSRENESGRSRELSTGFTAGRLLRRRLSGVFTSERERERACVGHV